MSEEPVMDPIEVVEEVRVHYGYSYGAISPFFREIRDHRRLVVTRCRSCGTGYCPPRADCARCWTETEWEPHSGAGVVVAPVYCYWTQINSPVRAFASPPFVYALVRLDGMANCLHALVHPEDDRLNRDVHVGTRVGVRFREERRGAATDIYFVPVGEGER